MEFEIRACRLEDADAICRLSREALGYDYPPEAAREKCRKLLNSEAARIYVAEADDRVVGYVHANDYDVLYAPHMKNIMGIAVSGDCRGSGVGRALLGAVEAWAKATGASAVRLVSGCARTGAHAFYRRCGYDRERQQLNFTKWLS